MIFLRTYGGDGSVGASKYLSIPTPIGVRDGDLILASICLPAANVVITPPDDQWTLIERTDTTRTGGIAVYAKTAMNEGARWVFGLSVSTYAVGGALVYGGVDSFEPIEYFASATSPSGTSIAVPKIAASEPFEELVLFLAGDAPGTITPLAGYEAKVSRAPAGGGTFGAHRKPLTAAGTQAATSVAVSAAMVGSSIALALRQSAGVLSVDQARERLIAALPGGVDDVYDLTPGGDYYRLLQSMAELLKVYGYDLVDLLRREIIPHRSVLKLSSWERLFGIDLNRTAKTGTVPQRQAQVKAAWRSASGQGSSVPAVKAILAPLLGYNLGTDVEVIESDRSMLRLANSYGLGGDVTLLHGQTTTVRFRVRESGLIGHMGAHVNIVLADPDASQYTITLTGPDGTTQTFAGGWKLGPIYLRAKNFVGKSPLGLWTIEINNPSASDNTLYGSQSWLFVEGVSRYQQTGGAVFCWGVYADPAHVGENGITGNLEEAERAIKTIAFSHTNGNLIRSKSPWPDVYGGEHASIPDQCLPS